MKKIVAAFLFLSLSLCAFAACSGGGGKDGSCSVGEVSVGEVSAAAPERLPDMASLSEQFRGAFTATELREFSANEIYDDTGIDTKDCEAFLWLAETSGLSSEKAVVFLAKDREKAAAIEEKLGALLQSELAQMKDYNADNYAMLQKAVAGARGRCAWLLVSPAAEAFAAIMDGAF